MSKQNTKISNTLYLGANKDLMISSPIYRNKLLQ